MMELESNTKNGAVHSVDPAFDAFADDYDAALNRGISVSGEDKEYFARKRVEWTAARLLNLGVQVRTALDYGCGIGTSVPYLLNILGAQTVTGLDVSAKTLEVARKLNGSPQTTFALTDEFKPDAQIDLAFCNGVIHHIPLVERAATFDYIYHALKPGGFFAMWENNPWNPGTRIVMARIPFDRDAVTLSAPTARKYARAAGFEIVRTDFLFIFPKALAPLRGMEPGLSSLPLGAQYLVLARKSASHT
jgi:SAM-dependent methyltransferase